MDVFSEKQGQSSVPAAKSHGKHIPKKINPKRNIFPSSANQVDRKEGVGQEIGTMMGQGGGAGQPDSP